MGSIGSAAARTQPLTSRWPAVSELPELPDLRNGAVDSSCWSVDPARFETHFVRANVAAMLTALDHVILAVGDLERATRDYRTLLGRSPSWTGVHPHLGTANVLFRLENTYVELLAPSGDGPLGDAIRARLAAVGDGFAGIALATPDIESCRRVLEERGLAPGPVEPGNGVDSTSGAERRWRRVSLPIDRTRGVFLFPIQHDSPAGALPVAEPEAEAGAFAHALDHAVVQTSDADAARSLYGDALGLRLAVDREFPQWGVRLMFFRVGGITLEVAGALPVGTEPAGGAASGFSAVFPGERAAAGSDRLYGLTWRVRSIERAHARLAAAGVDVSELRTGRRPGTRVFTVRSSTCGVPTLMIEFEAERS